MSEAIIASPLRVSRRRARPSWVIVVSFLIVGAVVVMAIFGAAIAPMDPGAQNLANALAPPSAEHWLGTDALGRDVFSRIIAGARSAFVGPLVIAAGAMLFGNLLGLRSGYRGGIEDAVVMRWVDFMWAVPGLLVIVVVAGAFGGGYWTAVILLLILTIPFDTRIIRGATLEQVRRPYVEAARTIGISDSRIMLFHIWPNIAAIAIANAFLTFAAALVSLSGLSYLGFGVEAGAPDWGVMLSDGTRLLFSNPIAAAAPATLIVITAIAMNLIGDWLYEVISRRGANR